MNNLVQPGAEVDRRAFQRQRGIDRRGGIWDKNIQKVPLMQAYINTSCSQHGCLLLEPVAVLLKGKERVGDRKGWTVKGGDREGGSLT